MSRRERRRERRATARATIGKVATAPSYKPKKGKARGKRSRVRLALVTSALLSVLVIMLVAAPKMARASFDVPEIDPGSILGDIVAEASGKLVIPVNSSHHQAADVIGDGLRAVARSPQDNIVEAVEGTSPDHFVLAVQWHPERSVHDDEPSRAIFRAFIQAARARHRKLVGEFEGL